MHGHYIIVFVCMFYIDSYIYVNDLIRTEWTSRDLNWKRTLVTNLNHIVGLGIVDIFM